MSTGVAQTGKESAGHGEGAADGSEKGHQLIRHWRLCSTVHHSASNAAAKVVTSAFDVST